jgi:glycerol-3-phosphate O-acyltransferase
MQLSKLYNLPKDKIGKVFVKYGQPIDLKEYI